MQPAVRSGLVLIAAKPREIRERCPPQRLTERSLALCISEPERRIDRHERHHLGAEPCPIVRPLDSYDDTLSERPHPWQAYGERQQQTASRREGVEPRIQRMRHASIHENRVERAFNDGPI